MRRLIHRVSAAFAALSVFVSLAAFPAVAAQDAEQAANPSGPAMWRISDEDSVIYLFGTLHVLPEDEDWATPVMRAALAETPVTYFEVAPDAAGDQVELTRLLGLHGMNTSGTRLADLVGAARWKRFSTLARNSGVDPELLQAQRPWLALIVLSAAAMENAGFKSEFGAEEVIEDIAESEQDQLLGLESLSDQISALASLDDETMLAHFDTSLDEIENVAEITAQLLAAWRTGDTAELQRLAVNDLAKEAPDAYKALFVDRNRSWVNQLEALLDGAGGHFVAVGAGHLIGPDSVLNMLDDTSVEIVRIQ